MKVVIIEDEKPAVDKLQNALGKCDHGIQVIAVLMSIHETVAWFKENAMPDLLFMDIELSDGLSFEIFDKTNITCPIIFTTAYDDYWQEAFEHNGIDYLLKPIRQEKLATALAKYGALKKYFAQNLQQLLLSQGSPGNGLKKRFLVKRGVDYISIKIEDIAYFYATHKVVCLVDTKGNKFILEQSLSDLESQIDPVAFYRVNRKYLVHINAIKKIKSYPKSKIQLEVDPPVTEEIIISQENVSSFKDWMAQ
ncbi:MAG: response regulator transcription factor [Chitinophagaceae bacterium]|nr:response regulator transcription factor [Chitinophagaceae bacterium]